MTRSWHKTPEQWLTKATQNQEESINPYRLKITACTLAFIKGITVRFEQCSDLDLDFADPVFILFLQDSPELK